MSHTILVQDIVSKHRLTVFDPISFNPYPIWMTTSKCGMTHYGVKMPTMGAVREQSHTFTSWEGHKFCKETLEVLSQLARKRIEKKPGDDNSGDDNSGDDDPDDEGDDESFDMQIFVTTPTGKTIAMDVENTFTINNIKAIIKNKEGIPTKQQRLIFNDQQLEDGYTISDYNIPNLATVKVLMSIRGGGKRAKPSVHNKEDKMSGLSEDVAAKTMLLSTPAYSCDETRLAITHINLIQKSHAEDPKTAVSKMLDTLNSEQLTNPSART